MPIYIPNTFDVSGNAEVAGGTGGGNVPTPTGTTINWQLDEFTSSGTYTKPAQAVLVEVVIIGTGGGGASGSRQASGVVSRGGSSGGIGAPAWATFNANAVPSSVAVTIGVAGSGGAAVAIDDTNGTTGGAGGTTSFGALFSVLGAAAGTFSTGGVSASWSSGGTTPRVPHLFTWNNGYASNTAGGVNTSFQQDSNAAYRYSAAAPGTGITNADVEAAGSQGNNVYASNFVLSSRAAGGAVGGGNGDPGISDYGNTISVGNMMYMSSNIGTKHVGTTAGSGGSAVAAAGGAGGAPGAYGASGAGGGASRNGFNSGAGGAGGGAVVKVLTMYLT